MSHTVSEPTWRSTSAASRARCVGPPRCTSQPPDQSIRFATFNFASSWCTWSKTPAWVQRCSRRQHLMPDPKPSSCGWSSQSISTCSTTRRPADTDDPAPAAAREPPAAQYLTQVSHRPVQQFVATEARQGDTADQDVKLFFALGNALLDASIFAWTAKFQYDSERPTTGIRERYRGQMITSWLGPNKGYGKVPGERWLPYQALNVVTPGFPEYVSGHSTFSAAGRAVINQFFGTDNFNAKVTIPAGSSKIEPGVSPAKPVVLTWKTLDAMADQAGMS